MSTDRINHDPEALATALGAFLEYQSDSNSQYDLEIFRFGDDRLRYELHILPNNGTAQLALDPTEPIQGCPMLEYSFRCTNIVIGESAYDESEIAVRFYEGDATPDGQRLTLTWIPAGYWYIWANANNDPYSKNGG